MSGYDYTCPICGGEIVERCKCNLTDSHCAYGHEFHLEHDPNAHTPHAKPWWRRAWHQGPANHGRGPCCENPVVLHPVTPLTNCVARGEAFARSADFIQGIIDRLSARLLGKAGIVGVSDNLVDGKLTIEVATTDLEATEALVPKDARVIGGIPIVLKRGGPLIPYEEED